MELGGRGRIEKGDVLKGTGEELGRTLEGGVAEVNKQGETREQGVGRGLETEGVDDDKDLPQARTSR